MRKLCLLAIAIITFSFRIYDTNYYALSGGAFTQNWTNATLITANDNWAGVASIQGFLGQDITTATGIDPQTLLTGASAIALDLDVIANQSNPNTLSNGGVAEFDGIANPGIALQGSGTADAPHLIIYLNSTGRTNVRVQYNLRDLDGSTDNAVQPVALQYRIGSSGNFTNLPAGFVADATTGPSLATLVTAVDVTLPATCNNQSQVEVRIITANAVGNDEWVSVDDINITSSVAVSSNADLSNLILSSGTLVPIFSSATTGYTANVANATSSITVTPTTGNANSTVTINGNSVLSGNASVPIPLNVGANVITTIVTAQDAVTTKTYTVTVTRAAAGTPLLTTTSALTDFGAVCINTTAGPNSFTLNGNNLDGSNIVLAPLPGFTYSESIGGPYTSSTLSFGYGGGSTFTGKNIYVKFGPTVVQSYSGDIILNGGGVVNYIVSAAGSGISISPLVTTGGSSLVTATSGTAAGTINVTGCGTITAYGIEYSTTSGFPDGTGTKINGSNLSAGNFTVTLTSLAPNTRYYYKAYVTNNGGATFSYGTQMAFTCTPLPVPMASQPALSYTQNFTDIGIWGDFFTSGNGANHFGGLSVNAIGTIPDGIKITASTANFNGSNFTSSGGVHRFIDAVTPTQSIIFLSTGSPDNTTSAALDFYMDFTGLNAGTLSFDYSTINNSTGDRNGSLRVYSTTDGITFTELTFADILSFTNNVPISGSKTNIALPASFNNSPTARLRFYYHNGSGNTGTGSRPKISIDNLNVTAVATTPCVSPITPATALTFGTITDVSIQGSFTAPSPASDGYLVVMSSNSSLTSNPVNGQTYNIGDNVGDGSVIAKGSSTTFTATGLTSLTTYYFFIFPVNSICTGGPLYFTTTVLNAPATSIAGLPSCTAPSSQPTNLVFGITGTNSIQGSFTATTANEYIVLRSTSSTLTNNPVNSQVYNAGDILGNAVVVQRSSATSFNANGLLPSTQYYFFVFSLNSQNCINGPVYYTALPLSGSKTTQPLPPCAIPSAQPTSLALTPANTSVAGTFTGVIDADNYLIVRSISSSLSSLPVNNSNYNVGNNLGGGTVIANSSSTSFLAIGLTANTTYYFFVFATNNNCSGGTKYLTANPLTGNIITANTLTNNYYFGSLHSHSDYSDGNQDHQGQGYTATMNFDYAMTAECMDFLGISDHNHFSSLDNPGTTVANYHLGVAEAAAFNSTHPNFLALYGMEWGVISGGGHVVVYGDGMDNLFGWESGSGVWGASNNYDVYVPKNTYTGNTGLFKVINDNIATNTFATLAHPNLTDFNGIGNTLPYNLIGDNAIVGTTVESGPSSSTNTTYSNPGSPMSYLWYYQTLLSKGYHLGPTIDHDNHKTTFGKTTRSRTAIVAPLLTRTELVKAMRNMHFYATEDCDSKVDFTINTQMLGTVMSDRFAPNISVILFDGVINTTPPSTTPIIRVMFGVPGSGIFPVKIDSISGTSLTITDNNLANLTTGYYYIDITTANGGRIITSPIWYTRSDNVGTLVTFTCPAPITVSCASAIPAPNTASINGMSVSCPGLVKITHVGDVISNQTCANRYTITRTYRATDICGNFSQCTQIITVNDQTPPVLTCPAPVTVSCANAVPAPNTTLVTGVSDNCGSTVTVTFVSDVISNQICANKFTLTRTYRATDVCGNFAQCTQIITVNDQTAPVITCPSNIAAVTPIGSCTAVITFTPTATDNCGGAVTITSIPASGSVFAMGTTPVNVTATDACGNSSTCTFNITVSDSQLPVIGTQPANKTVCATSTASFSVSASNAVSYQWQQFLSGVWTNIAGQTGSSLTFTAVTQNMNTNTYRVNVIGLCTSIISNPATLYVNPLPTINLTASNPPVLLPTQTTSIVANVNPPGGTFAWFKNGVARVPTVTTGTLSNLTVDDAGTYKATYTDPNGCVATSGVLVLSAALSERFYVAPNPNNGQFWIRYYNLVNEQLTLIVYDSKGRKVHQQVSPANLPYTRIEVKLNAASSSGIYLVELRGADGRVLGVKRIVVYRN